MSADSSALSDSSENISGSKSSDASDPYNNGGGPAATTKPESRVGLAARRAAQLPKLRDLIRKQRPESTDIESSSMSNVGNLNVDFCFTYSDSDALLRELSELYSYSEEEELIENADTFTRFAESRCIYLWSRISLNLRKTLIFSIIEELELVDRSRRWRALQCLAYLTQGNFMECDQDDDVVRLITTNAYLLYECGVWPSLLSLLSHELDSSSTLTGSNTNQQSSMNGSDSKWLRTILNCLYTLLEVIRRDDSKVWRDEQKLSDPEISRRLTLRQSFIEELGYTLPGSDQFLAAVLFDAVSRFCTSICPQYPIKKLLLLLWKTVLTWCGDFERLQSMKNEVRARYRLPPCDDTVSVACTMEAVPPPCLPTNAIADIIGAGGQQHGGTDGDEGPGLKRERPLLAKRQLACMASDEERKPPDGIDEGFEDVPEDANHNLKNSASTPTTTTAMTDMDRPGSPRPADLLAAPLPSLVPLQPAFKALPWSLKVRPQDIEMFLDRERAKFFKFQIPNDKQTLAGLPRPILDSFDTLNKHMYTSLADKQIEREQLINLCPFSHKDIDDPEPDLRPVEMLYRAILPQVAQYVIGLLKMLLAGAPTSKPKTDAINLLTEIMAPSAMSTDHHHQDSSVSFDGISSSVKMTLEVNRHKEIIVKAISSLLLLLLKHFKLNHVFQFEYLSQHLVFANCIPLILKFFDQNILLYVQSENEIALASFPTNMLHYAKTKELKFKGGVGDWLEEHLMKDIKNYKQGYFLWRNMFAAVNLLRILNKLTKWKHARTMMLVVFKSAPILKRALRVKHILLQLFALKLLKMQAKYLGRQWRKTNMELMSAIYNKVRHRLNDNWAYGNETQAKPWDFQLEEASMREAVEKFNNRRYKDILKLGFSGSSSSSTSPSCGEDDDFKPLDNNVISVLGARYELTDRFKHNYEHWLDREVFKAKIDWDQLISDTSATSIARTNTNSNNNNNAKDRQNASETG